MNTVAAAAPTIQSTTEPAPVTLPTGWQLLLRGGAHEFNLWERDGDLALTLGVGADGLPTLVDPSAVYLVDLTEARAAGELVGRFVHISDGRLMIPVRRNNRVTSLPVRGRLAEAVVQRAGLNALVLVYNRIQVRWQNMALPRPR